MRTALIIAAILSVGLGTLTTNCADPDLWGHIQYGREVLQDGTLPKTTTWSFAAEGAPWVNHENIAELLLAWTVDTFGVRGLPVMKLILAIVILGLIMWTARRAECGWPAIGITVLLVASNLQFHWHFRPQILSYVSLASMLAIWQRAFHCQDASFAAVDLQVLRRQMRSLWLLPPLLCFWANAHGGFAAGVAILIAYHGMVSLQLLLAHGRQAAGLVVLLVMVSSISVAATLVNPYGLTLWKFMLAALELPRPEIADWGPLELWTFESIRFWTLLLTAVGGFTFALLSNRREYGFTEKISPKRQMSADGAADLRRRAAPSARTRHGGEGIDAAEEVRLRAKPASRQHRRRILASQFLSQAVLMTLLLWQGMSHCRHMSIVAIVCGFFLPVPLHRLISFAAAGFQRRAAELANATAATQGRNPLLVSGVLSAILIFNVARLAPQVTDVSVDRSEFPVSAMQFMHDRNLHGKVVVTFNWAQYAIGCFAEERDPARQSRVAVDGRFETCYPREITDIYFDFWLGTNDPKQRYRSPQTPTFDPARALEFHAPDLVLISREQRPSVREMQRHTDDWVLLYQDSLAQLWGRRSVYEAPESPQFLAASLHSITDDPQIGSVSWPALPAERIRHQQLASSAP